MSGKVIIVTGANNGIGFEVTKVLCEAGHDVIMACRNEDKTTRSIEKLKRKLPNALATYMNLDLANLESIRKFVEDFHATGKKLNVLINNAGVALDFKDTKRQFTKDNFELTIGTNHLGHFLLTNLLLEDLKKTAKEDGDARIIVVASSIHDVETNKRMLKNVQNLDLDDIFMAKENAFNGLQAYKNSKAANVMFTYELSRQLIETNVKVNTMCPGFVPTTELLQNSGKVAKLFCRYVLRFTKMARTVQQAATAIVSLATDEKYKDVTGKFFRDGQETTTSEESMEEEKQKKLWQLSGSYTKLEGFEPLDAPVPPVEVEKKDKPEKKEEVAASIPIVNGVKDVMENVKAEITEKIEETKIDTEKIIEVKNDVTEKVERKIEIGIVDIKHKAEEIIEKVENTVKENLGGIISNEKSPEPEAITTQE